MHLSVVDSIVRLAVAALFGLGIGFIGGGTILKRDDHIEGLTTAASLWVVGALGLAAGVGLWSAAVAGTVIALLALVAERPLRHLVTRLRSQRGARDVDHAASNAAHACSQRRHASAQTRQCSCISACCSHSSAQIRHASRHASSAVRVSAAS